MYIVSCPACDIVTPHPRLAGERDPEIGGTPGFVNDMVGWHDARLPANLNLSNQDGAGRARVERVDGVWNNPYRIMRRGGKKFLDF